VVYPNPTLTVRSKSNGTHHACVLMSRWICDTHSHSLSSPSLSPATPRSSTNPNHLPNTVVSFSEPPFTRVSLPWIRQPISGAFHFFCKLGFLILHVNLICPNSFLLWIP
jgi:hypothetical protein